MKEKYIKLLEQRKIAEILSYHCTKYNSSSLGNNTSLLLKRCERR